MMRLLQSNGPPDFALENHMASRFFRINGYLFKTSVEDDDTITPARVFAPRALSASLPFKDSTLTRTPHVTVPDPDDVSFREFGCVSGGMLFDLANQTMCDFSDTHPHRFSLQGNERSRRGGRRETLQTEPVASDALVTVANEAAYAAMEYGAIKPEGVLAVFADGMPLEAVHVDANLLPADRVDHLRLLSSYWAGSASATAASLGEMHRRRLRCSRMECRRMMLVELGIEPSAAHPRLRLQYRGSLLKRSEARSLPVDGNTCFHCLPSLLRRQPLKRCEPLSPKQKESHPSSAPLRVDSAEFFVRKLHRKEEKRPKIASAPSYRHARFFAFLLHFHELGIRSQIEEDFIHYYLCPNREFSEMVKKKKENNDPLWNSPRMLARLGRRGELKEFHHTNMKRMTYLYNYLMANEKPKLLRRIHGVAAMEKQRLREALKEGWDRRKRLAEMISRREDESDEELEEDDPDFADNELFVGLKNSSDYFDLGFNDPFGY